MEKIYVAVVGAGFAGLTAAYELHNSGFAVTVLEAQSRVGGRVWSTELSNGAAAELGGEWIWSEDKDVIRMADRLDLPLVKVGVDFRIRKVVNGPAVSIDQQNEANRIGLESLSALDPQEVSELTIGEFLEDLPVSGAQRLLLSCRLGGSFGADLHNIALRMLGDYSLGDSSDYYRLAKGNQSLAEGLAAQVPDVRLGHVVTRVAHHHSGVIVYGRGQDEFEIAVEAVILAIPVKILAKLPFDPPLPPLIDKAISSVPMGTAAKLAIGAWNQPAPFAIQDAEAPYWSWCGLGHGGRSRPAITAFCGSNNAQKKLNAESKDPSLWVSRLK